jgi:hypothetical protein
MPTPKTNPANTIDEKSLPPHMQLRFRRKSNTSNPAPVDGNSIIRLAGEAIKAGNSVYVDGSGLVMIADYTGTPADGIAENSGNEGDQIKILQYGKLYIDGASFTVGEDVWLCAGDINLTTDAPDIEDETIIQKIGKAIETDWILIEIGDPIF